MYSVLCPTSFLTYDQKYVQTWLIGEKTSKTLMPDAAANGKTYVHVMLHHFFCRLSCQKNAITTHIYMMNGL